MGLCPRVDDAAAAVSAVHNVAHHGVVVGIGIAHGVVVGVVALLVRIVLAPAHPLPQRDGSSLEGRGMAMVLRVRYGSSVTKEKVHVGIVVLNRANLIQPTGVQA